MSLPVLSVVVPVYKVEKHLRKCVNSILGQTFEDFELILVDDGSPDKCPEICDEYAASDNRVMVIHKENGGLSDARNVGIAHSRGKYIGIVDSDDHIVPEMYEKMIAALEKNDADMCICNYKYLDEEGGIISDNKTESPIVNEVLNKNEAQEKLISEKYWYYVTACNKLYKKSLFDDIKFRTGFLHEDEFIIHHLFEKCERIAVIDDYLYMYVQRNSSIMGQKSNIKHLDGVFAVIERYYFFKEHYPRLAYKTALRGYNNIADSLINNKYHTWHGEYKKCVFKMIRILLSEHDLRCVKLFLIWLRNI